MSCTVGVCVHHCKSGVVYFSLSFSFEWETLLQVRLYSPASAGGCDHWSLQARASQPPELLLVFLPWSFSKATRAYSFHTSTAQRVRGAAGWHPQEKPLFKGGWELVRKCPNLLLVKWTVLRCILHNSIEGPPKDYSRYPQNNQFIFASIPHLLLAYLLPLFSASPFLSTSWDHLSKKLLPCKALFQALFWGEPKPREK